MGKSWLTSTNADLYWSKGQWAKPETQTACCMSYYYWLVPLIILAIIAVAVFAYAGRRKATLTDKEGEAPEAIKRGRFMNK